MAALCEFGDYDAADGDAADFADLFDREESGLVSGGRSGASGVVVSCVHACRWSKARSKWVGRAQGIIYESLSELDFGGAGSGGLLFTLVFSGVGGLWKMFSLPDRLIADCLLCGGGWPIVWLRGQSTIG